MLSSRQVCFPLRKCLLQMAIPVPPTATLAPHQLPLLVRIQHPPQVWTTLQVAIPVPPTVAAGPEAAAASRLLTRFAHPLAAIIGITAMRWAAVML